MALSGCKRMCLTPAIFKEPSRGISVARIGPVGPPRHSLKPAFVSHQVSSGFGIMSLYSGRRNKYLSQVPSSAFSNSFS